MAMGKKTGGRNFKPGVVTNPKGREKMPEELKDARRQNKIEFDTQLHTLLKLPFYELKEVVKDSSCQSLKLLAATVLVKAITAGDHMRMGFLLDRAFGKVPDEHNVTGSLHSMLVAEIAKRNAAKKLES